MAVKLGHASLGANGKISGDIAGDQNGKEVTTRFWYNKPWSILLRPISDEVAEKSAQACEAGCANPAIGYNQAKRNTAHIEAQKVGYDLSKIKTPCETDCSAFMTLCAIAGGVNELEYKGNAPTTSTMANAFVRTGKYMQITDSKYLTSDKYLKRGDILIKPGSHTVMALENGSGETSKNNIVKTKSTYPCKGIDVSSYQTDLNYLILKSSGVQFAILKIMNKDGNVDKLFETHYKGFTQAGIPVMAVYNYSYATTIEKAKIDALAVIKYLNGRKIPVCLDVEDNCQKNMGEKLIDIINAYQSVVENAGLDFVLYTGNAFYNSFINPYRNKLKCKNIWIARYYKGYNEMSLAEQPDDRYKPNIPNLMGWQYTSSLKVNGSSQRLDCSIMYYPIQSSVKNPNSKTGVVTANSLRIRTQPNQQGNTVGYLKKGEQVEILGTDAASGWYQIGQSLYVSNEYIQIL